MSSAGSRKKLCRYFASSDRTYGPEEFADVRYSIGATGTPRLDGAICVLDCTVHDVARGGDHDIYIGEVKALKCVDGGEPLLFYAGHYRAVAPPQDS